MSEVCALLGIPCKQSGSGNEVLNMYNDGKIEEICNYCEEDVIFTYMLYLNYQMHNGKMSIRLFESCTEDAIKMLEENKILDNQTP